MRFFDPLWHKIKKLNWKIFFSIGILVLVLFVIVKSCSSKKTLQKNNFTIAYDRTWYPHQVADKDMNLIAFSTELLLAIANLESFQVNIIETGPEGLMDGLDNGNYDAILSGMRPNSMLRHYYSFSNPYFLLGPVLIVPQKSTVHYFKDMKSKSVGINSDNYQEYDVTQPPSMTLIPYAYILPGFADLDLGRIDGMILDLLPAYSYTTGFYAGQFRIASAPLTNEGLRLIARQNQMNNHLILRFNEGLNTLKETGAYNKLLVRWNLFQTNQYNLSK